MCSGKLFSLSLPIQTNLPRGRYFSIGSDEDWSQSRVEKNCRKSRNFPPI